MTILEEKTTSGCVEKITSLGLFDIFANNAAQAEEKLNKLGEVILQECLSNQDKIAAFNQVWNLVESMYVSKGGNAENTFFVMAKNAFQQTVIGGIKNNISDLFERHVRKCIKEFMVGLAKFGAMIGRLAMKNHDDFIFALKVFGKEIVPMMIKCYTPF